MTCSKTHKTKLFIFILISWSLQITFMFCFCFDSLQQDEDYLTSIEKEFDESKIGGEYIRIVSVNYQQNK